MNEGDLKRNARLIRNADANPNSINLNNISDEYLKSLIETRNPKWIPSCYFIPGVLYSSFDNFYFLKLYENNVGIREFLFILSKKSIWNIDDLKNDVHLAHLKYIIDTTYEELRSKKNIQDDVPYSEYDTYYPKIEIKINTMSIINNINKYRVIQSDGKNADVIKIIMAFINQINDVDFKNEIEGLNNEARANFKANDPLLRPILKPSPDKGLGLFAMQEYKPGDYVALYGDGKSLRRIQKDEPASAYAASIFIENNDIDKKLIEWISKVKLGEFILDATYGWSLKARGRFINHTHEKAADNCEYSVDRQLEETAFDTTKTPNRDNLLDLMTILAERKLFVVAKRHISVGEELLVHYGREYPYEKFKMQEPTAEPSISDLDRLYEFKEDGTPTFRKDEFGDPTTPIASYNEGKLYYNSKEKEYVFDYNKNRL